ncbi:hypothetical protein GCM10017752_51240 [Streptomyces roseoviridis]
MPAETEGAVDDDRAGVLQGGRQHVQAPLEHHRDVSVVAQCALSDPAETGTTGERKGPSRGYRRTYGEKRRKSLDVSVNFAPL